MAQIACSEDAPQTTLKYESPFSKTLPDPPLFVNTDSSAIRRRRLLSLPLLEQEGDLVEKVRRSLHIGRSQVNTGQLSFTDTRMQPKSEIDHSPALEGEEKEKKYGSIRTFIRRASLAVRPRRNSHSWTNTSSEVPESKPPGSSRWNRLRQAASFRQSRDGIEFEGAEDSFETLVAPIPGFGTAPPVIPRNSGGAAARATAAAQNVHLERTRLLDIEDPQADRESGVGIAVTVSHQSQLQHESINRVDFITALPSELAIQILSHLDHRGLVQAALVSQNWSRISSTSHVWREAFCREKSSTYAMSGPIIPGTGYGLPTVQPDKPWKDIYRVRHELEANWRGGKARPVYLNGHLDSIYCVQFDE
jgi:F-box and WD-40 domain protein 1/11